MKFKKGDIVRYKNKRQFTFIVKQEKDGALGLYKIFAPAHKVNLDDWEDLNYIGNYIDNPKLLLEEG